MSREIKAFIWSSGLHALIFIGLIALSRTMITYSKPIIIDFSIEDTVHTLKEETKRSSTPARSERVKKEENRAEPQQTIKELLKKEVEPVKESTVTETYSEEQVTVPEVLKTANKEIVSEVQDQGHHRTRNSDIREIKADGRSGNIISSSSTVDSTERARQKYIKEHFAYIRDIITRNISYPHMARKMGWAGKVTISFVITEDGSAKDIKIIESSGFDVLDRNAADTVKKVSPFPRPPVRAEVIVPVVYRLN